MNNHNAVKSCFMFLLTTDDDTFKAIARLYAIHQLTPELTIAFESLLAFASD